MEGKGSFVILLVIISILTLTLAVMAGYLFFVTGTSQAAANGASPRDTIKSPSDNELAKKILYSEKTFFNLNGGETGRNSVIQLGVVLKYYKKVSGVKNVEEKLDARDEDIKELISTYFQKLTLEDVKSAECKKKAKEDLILEINNLLKSNEKRDIDIIYDVVFEEWFYQ